MSCLSCGRGFHNECETECVKCHPEIIKSVSITKITGTGLGAPTKDPESVKDRHSTGRKRAAQLYPIFKEQNCEWQGKKNCGGGLKPIVACLNGKQRHRHHGPVKDTLRNEPGNVHRICTSCHVHWHAENDPIYDEEAYNKLPHSPEEATEIELAAAAAYWMNK